jgi:hypothetical protein
MATTEEMDAYAQQAKDVLIDDFARLSEFINNKDYYSAAVFMLRMSDAMNLLANAFAMEALARRLDERFGSPGLDKPDEV